MQLCIFNKGDNNIKMQISKYLDPFNIPTLLNNLCVLIIAGVTKLASDETLCRDP